MPPDRRTPEDDPRQAAAKRDAVLLSSLRDAWADRVERQSPDPRTWNWGAAHPNPPRFHPPRENPMTR
ncbi:hypothethical protein (plasmid) [Ralstonia solanacearum CMR15]|nr:hypothethical protein [Ralstonia solanacearum CMR15]